MTAESAQRRDEETQRVTRGVRRLLAELGVESVREVMPAKGLRADVFGVAADGAVWIVEVKSGVEDFRADQKWRGYLDWCDRFYFAVGPAFPLDLLPDEVGLIRADAYGGAILRDGAQTALAPARRKVLVAKAARFAAARLRRLEDPDGPM